jgi:hypothetical protein
LKRSEAKGDVRDLRPDHQHKYSGDYALAVRPGEVSAVPVPSAILLLGSGLLGLGASRRAQGGDVGDLVI